MNNYTYLHPANNKRRVPNFSDEASLAAYSIRDHKRRILRSRNSSEDSAKESRRRGQTTGKTTVFVQKMRPVLPRYRFWRLNSLDGLFVQSRGTPRKRKLLSERIDKRRVPRTEESVGKDEIKTVETTIVSVPSKLPSSESHRERAN